MLRSRFGADLNVTVSPLLEIIPVANTLDLTGVNHLLFTSVNGVTAYCAATDRRDIECLCVGDRTADLAAGHGMKATSAKGSAEDLLNLALGIDPSDGTILHIRGQHTAKSLCNALMNKGYTAREVILYDQKEIGLTGEAAGVLTSLTKTLVPFFSPRTAEVFMDAADALAMKDVVAICISQNTVHKLDTGRFAEIRVAGSPNVAAMINAMVSAD